MNSINTSKIAVLGAGISGNGAAVLAHKLGYDVFVSDSKAIKDIFKQELQALNIAYEEGGHNWDNILDANIVIKSPGIPPTAPIIKAIKEKGITLMGEIEFAYRHKGDSKIIAITGTNGKSTTTKLMGHILQTAGFDVAVVGNIGRSFAEAVANNPAEWYVIEVSSFQLEDIIDFTPEIAIILNITPDHLDRYNYDMAQYVAAKFNITRNQQKQHLLILNKDDQPTQQYLLSHSIHTQIVFFSMNEEIRGSEGAYLHNNSLNIQIGDDPVMLPVDDISIKGKHNQANTMAAAISAKALHIRNEKLRESCATFVGLDHRLTYIATIRGVEYYNDSKATNINSTWYALEAFKKPVVLILGGQDKGNDYGLIEELVAEKVRGIVCLGKSNDKIINYFKGKVATIADTHSAEEAALAAFNMAEKGDVVLLSPACASFDLFENYEDRGRQFTNAVKNL